MTFYITAIDIGLHNLGIIKCKIVDNIITICDFELVDLYKYRNDQPELHMMIDYLVSEYQDMFNSKYILIERQPPGGLIAIQEVIAFIFKDKVKIISPRSVHSKLGLNYYSYEGRKIKSEKILMDKLCIQNNTEIINKINSIERKHDISDAYCMIDYFICFVLYNPIKKKIPKIELSIDLDTYFNIFSFKNNK